MFPTSVKDGKVYVEIPKRATAEDLTNGVEPPMCKALPSDTRHFVILGAGPCGLAAAETLRAEGFTGRITMINREAGVPYDRTKLSKSMNVEPSRAALRSAGWLEAKGIVLRTGVRCTAVETGARRALLDDGSALEYTALLCATGGPARTFREDAKEPGPIPPIPGAHLAGIFPLRTLEHARGLEAAVEAATAKEEPIVVQGASFIGMECAAYFTASKGARNVTVVDMFPVPFMRTLGPRLGKFMQVWHESRGVKFVLGGVVRNFTAGARGAVASATVGFPSPIRGQADVAPPLTLPAAVVAVGGGIVPAVDYLAGAAGVVLVGAAPGGVEVDEFQRTGDPHVYAAGDIAHIPLRYAAAPGSRWRIEHWNVAIDQGRVAAKNMMAHHPSGSGAPPTASQAAEPYTSVPFFWTAMYGKYLRCAGFCKAADAVVVQGIMQDGPGPYAKGKAPGDSRFNAFFIAGGRVEAFMSFNEEEGAPYSVAALELIRLRSMPPPGAIEEGPARLNLMELLAQARQHSGPPVEPIPAGGGGSGLPKRRHGSANRELSSLG